MNRLTINEIPELSYFSREAMNRLRINLGYCGKYKRILITSSVPGEGKSTLAINLWKTLAEAGNRILLVDADIRKSLLRSRYKIVPEMHNAPGLVSYLAGQATINDVLYKTNIENAYLLPTFRTISNPSLLLTNLKFNDTMEMLKSEQGFDYILVDSAPIASVADGIEIAGSCDGALLVVRGDFAPRKIIAESIQMLDKVNCPIIGTILNQVKVEKSSYYSKYYHYSYYEKD